MAPTRKETTVKKTRPTKRPSQEEIAKHMTVLDYAFREDWPPYSSGISALAENSFIWLVENYGSEILRYIPADVLQADATSVNAFLGRYFEYIGKGGMFRKKIFRYWNKNGRTEAALMSSLRYTGRWMSLDANKAAKEQLPMDEGYEIENATDPATEKQVDVHEDWNIWRDKTNNEFIELLGIGLASKDQRERYKAVLFVLYLYYDLKQLGDEATKPIEEATIQYCAKATNRTPRVVEGELNAAYRELLTKPRSLKKRRFSIEQIGRWMGVKPHPNSGYGQLMTMLSRLKDQMSVQFGPYRKPSE